MMLASVAILSLALLTEEEAAGHGPALDLTRHSVGFAAIAVFAAAYLAVMFEERLQMRKSQPVIVAAGLIWLLVGVGYAEAGNSAAAAALVRTNLGEYAELFLFILAAVTFVNTMEERQLFDGLRAWLVSKGFSLKALFWLTGLLAFFLSPFLDNLTTALVLGTIAVNAGRGFDRFIALACVNVVVAANAGGAFSPFGDITTLMVWQAGRAEFWDFFRLFIPSLLNWFIPALAMSFAIPSAMPHAGEEQVVLRRGAWAVVGLFAGTVALAVTFYDVLGLPPVLGMMTGLGALKLYGYYLDRSSRRTTEADSEAGRQPLSGFAEPTKDSFNVFEILQRVEWDTLMFFYGIIVSVGGLAALGYLDGLSAWLYGEIGATPANIAVGIISAVVDNIPVMYAVLSMNPDMDLGQWLLVTLTAGVGGSMLSIGSAAGVALMGQARGIYTFFAHLRWTWAIILGYAASIWVHMLINT
jgi:Na+/H+ antiporter NhaD/arsenite permease-like protein